MGNIASNNYTMHSWKCFYVLFAFHCDHGQLLRVVLVCCMEVLTAIELNHNVTQGCTCALFTGCYAIRGTLAYYCCYYFPQCTRFPAVSTGFNALFRDGYDVSISSPFAVYLSEDYPTVRVLFFDLNDFIIIITI